MHDQLAEPLLCIEDQIWYLACIILRQDSPCNRYGTVNEVSDIRGQGNCIMGPHHQGSRDSMTDGPPWQPGAPLMSMFNIRMGLCQWHSKRLHLVHDARPPVSPTSFFCYG